VAFLEQVALLAAGTEVVHQIHYSAVVFLEQVALLAAGTGVVHQIHYSAVESQPDASSLVLRSYPETRTQV
jgi:hypothetical protein